MNDDLTEYEIAAFEKEHKMLCPMISEKEWIDTFPAAAIPYLKRRRRALKKELNSIESDMQDDFVTIYKTIPEEEVFPRWFFERVVEELNGEKLEGLNREIRKISFLIKPPEERQYSTTPNMIEKAKNVPFESLIKFNRSGFAPCPFHSEKSASFHFYRKKNRAYCFGCGWSGDTLKFTQDYYTLSFPEAVKKLN